MRLLACVYRYLGFDFKRREVTIGGEGNKPVSFTTRRDLARFLAHVLTSLPYDQLEWKIFRIEGDRVVRVPYLSLSPSHRPLTCTLLSIQTFVDVVRQYEQRTGKQITVTHIPRAELERQLQADPNDFVAYLRLDWDNGNGVAAQDPEELDNKLWPEWNPMKVLDTILQTQPYL